MDAVMERTRIKRILFMLPVAVFLVIHNARTEGWGATAAPFKQFLWGSTALVILFRLFGWM
jgi:hypothetical protein